MNIKLILFFLIILAGVSFAQEDVNIIHYLQEIERGNIDEIKSSLPELKKKSPGAPSLLYLEGVLTEDGREAEKIFTLLADTYPKSYYADAALFRLYSYYSAINETSLSKKTADKLLKDYSYSPYTKLIPADTDDEIAPVSEYLFSIQAGAFSNNTNAENLRRRFVKAGYHTVVKDKNVGGTLFKIVYTGRFRTRSEAESFQAILNEEYGLKGIITSYQE
jgi:hypothetical protein